MTLLPWLVVAFLVAVNALYVAAEFSSVAVQRSQLVPLARDGNRLAAGLLTVLGDGVQLDRYIAACQIGITLSSLVAGAYGQATIGVELGPWIEDTFGLSAAAAKSSAFISVLLVLTTLQVVIGELVPKSLALQFPERVSLATYLPTRWSVSLYGGFIWLLNGSGFLLLRPFGVTPGGHQHVHSPEEIKFMVAESHRGGALSPEAHQRIERGLLLPARTVRQMMTPRSEVYGVDASLPEGELLRRILESPFGRIVVYQGSMDHVIGAVNVKDVAGWFAAHGEAPALEHVLRPIPVVPETLRAHRFVRFLQAQQSSKAIVVDELGGVQGIISIEDVLGGLFGDIGDELKEPEPGAERLPDGTLRLPGHMDLDEAEDWLGVRWVGVAHTVGGHIVTSLGRLPSEGERLDIDGVELTVVQMSPTAVAWIAVHPPADPDETARTEEG